MNTRIFGTLAVILWIILAWFTHIVVCLKAGSWGFLIAGAIFFPVAFVYGTGILLGIF
ncbi:hypothetical protein ACOTDF_19510 [Achromobacter insuavis]|uniref:hypothetical protein n=1 Tax=Achromobacter insuavis TaxID=1287735 RepID=UPI003B9D3873